MSGKMIVSMSDRLALIDHFNPTDEVVCQAFGMTQEELDLARNMSAAGLIRNSTNIDYAKYVDVFSISQGTPVATIATTKTVQRPQRSGTSTTHTRPESASRPSRAPLKRGRKGTKIATALQAITTTPQNFNEFLAKHGVSAAVMKQSKRFIAELEPDVAKKIGVVYVRQDKNTKVQMIWREDA